jgi:precorrin isomerase
MLRLEVEIARPPTRKCRAVIEVMEDALTHFPGRVRLVVYERGVPWQEEPTTGFRKSRKIRRVPKAFVGGKIVALGQAPRLEEVLTAIRSRLPQSKP